MHEQFADYNQMDSLQDWQTTFDIIIQQCKRIVGHATATVFRRHDQLFEPIKTSPSSAEVTRLDLFLINKLQDQLASTALAGRPLIVSNLGQSLNTDRQHLTKKSWPDWLLQDGSTVLNSSWLVLPIVIQQQILALLCLSHPEPNYFTPQKVRRATIILTQAIQTQTRFYNQIQEKVVQNERQRLARELHDSIMQVFYGIELSANAASVLLSRGETAVVETQLREIIEQAEAGLSEMRTMLLELVPQTLETSGLVGALLKQIAWLRTRHKLEVIAVLGQEPAVPMVVKEALYRITQEAFNNIVKHAQASQVGLTLETDLKTGQIKLEIRDNGRGFEKLLIPEGHFGIRSILERSRTLNGKVDLESNPHNGTHLTVTLPLLDFRPE